MNEHPANAAPFAATPMRRRAAPALAALLALLLADCGPPTPKGQVAAVVNGQEVTVQDINSEAMAEGARRSSDPKVLLNKVIGRVLLAQQAHTMGLDQYAGFPADLNRMKQTLLAQRALAKLVPPPPTPPTQAQIQAFMEQHPNVFRNRMRMAIDEITFDPSVNADLLKSETTLPSLAARLKSIDATFQQQSRILDTAELPPKLVEDLQSRPLGEMFYIRTPATALAVVIKERMPVQVLALEQNQLALNLLAEQSAQLATQAALKRLEAQARIVYQPNFAPSTKPAPTGQTPAADPKG